jgi:maltodextrin utilization protein YvdJ
MSWLAGGLKSSFSNLKDQVASSIKDVLEELEDDETDTDLLDENSGRDAETRLLMAVDRLKDLRQTLDDQKKQISESKKKYEIVAENAKELEISKETEQKQFKQLLLDKEEEIELFSSKLPTP